MTVINTYDKPAGDIQVGNYLFGQKVEKVNRRIKKTTISLAEPVDKKCDWEFRLTDMLEVGVEELTEAEVAAKEAEDLAFRKEFFVDQVRDFVPSAQKAVDAAEARQAERREKGWGMLDHWVLDQLMEAWAQADLAREIDAVFSAAADGTFHLHDGDCQTQRDEETGNYFCVMESTYDDYAVAVHIVNRMTHRLTQRALNIRVLSRSTSITSNLCDDMQTAAIASFINSLRYSTYGLPGVKLIERY